MKEKKIKILTACLLLAALTACGGNGGNTSSEPIPDSTISENENSSINEVNSDELSSSEVSISESEEPIESSEESIESSEESSISINDKEDVSFGENGTLPADKWVYWNDQWWVGSKVVVHEAYVYNNEAIFDYEYLADSKTDWGFQLFYDNTSLEEGKTYKLTMDIYVEDDVNIKLNGTSFSLTSGMNENITVSFVEPSSGNASISMQIDKPADYRNTIKISNVNFEGTIGKLNEAEGIVVSDVSDGKVIAFAEVNGASSYTVIYYDYKTGSEVTREDITAPGDKLSEVSTLTDGIYKVHIIAIGDNITYTDSNISTSFATIVIGDIGTYDPTVKTNISFGEETALPLNEYVYWNDQWWCNSFVTVHESYIYNNELVFDYEYDSNSSTDWGFQVFYKNVYLVAGKTYTLTLNINSEDSINVKVNGKSFTLNAGDNSIEVQYTEGGSASGSLSIQFDKSTDLRNTVKLSNISWTESE